MVAPSGYFPLCCPAALGCFPQPPEAERELVETLESTWFALFEEAQNVEHSLGGIKKTFTEVP